MEVDENKGACYTILSEVGKGQGAALADMLSSDQGTISAGWLWLFFYAHF